MAEPKSIKFKKNSSISLTINIKGNAVDIDFTFLGTSKTVAGVEYFNFISKTQKPFPQAMSLATIKACLPAPSVPATFALSSLTQTA